MSTPPAMKLTDAFLDAKRMRGDAAADDEEWRRQYPAVSYDLWHRVLRFWRGVRNRMRERLL